MGVVRVGHVRVGVPQRRVGVAVAVLARRHRLVRMVVVPVFVAVRVFVFECFVFVLVAM